jgi:tetratricopeptide (TPR) repeat protein
MRPLLVLALVGLPGALASAPAHAQTPDEVTAERLLREGTAARQNGRVDDAITALDRALALKPADGDTQLQLGLSLFAKGRFDEAGRAFRKILAATPEYDDARVGLIRVLLATKDLDGAARELAALKLRAPNDPEVKTLEAQVEAGRQPQATAVPALRSSAAVSPSPDGATTEARRLFVAGQAARKAGRFDQAITQLAKVVALDPRDVDAQVELGLALIPRQRFAEAREAFTKVLATTPTYGDARLGLARIAFYEKRPAEAAREVGILLAREPGNREARALRAQIARAAADLEAAAEKARLDREQRRIALAKAQAQAAEQRSAERAKALRKAGKFPAAEAIYRTLLRAHPRDADLLVSAGSMAAFQGKARFADARRDFEAATAIDPRSDDAVLGLARVDLYEGKLEDAEARTTSVLARRPENTEAQALSARVILARGEPSEAEAIFRQLRTRLPEDTDILLGLGDSLRGTLQDDAARSVYRDAAAVDPDSAEIQARVAQAIRPRWRLDLDGSLSSLTRNGSDWQEGSVRLGYALSDRTVVTGGIEVTNRFKKLNTLIDARIDHRWSDTWTSYLRLGGAPDAVYRPIVFAEAGGTFRLSQGSSLFGATLLTLDSGYAKYSATEVETASPGIQQYLLDGHLWISGKVIGTLADSRVTERALDGLAFVRDRLDKFGGYSVRIDGTPTDRLTLFVGWADAPDTSDGRVIPTQALYGGGIYALSDTLSLKLSAAHEDRVKSYDRTSVNVGLTTRF